MPNQLKYNRILDALQELLENRNMQTISVSDIAQTAGIGKGSIYYYFPSKDAILDALVERNYEKPLQTAKDLADRTEISPFTRMAMIFQACRSSSSEFLKSEERAGSDTQEKIFLRQKYVNHIITELKPVLAEIIRQGVESGDIHFSDPDALAEIVLIVLAVKFDNSLVPSSKEDIERTIDALILLLEKGIAEFFEEPAVIGKELPYYVLQRIPGKQDFRTGSGKSAAPHRVREHLLH